MVTQGLPRIIPRWKIDLVVCNAENAAGGSGLTKRPFEELREAGVDIFTLGDHAYRKDEIFSLFEQSDRLCRAANWPTESPGPELIYAEARDGTIAAVFTILGRTFMKPVDCPFRSSERILERIAGTTSVVIVDHHAEASSDKQLLGRYLDGQVSAVLGTHTHVPTADEMILPRGTAYQTDVGMTGPYDSVIGRCYDDVIAATLTQVPRFFEVASGDPRLCGAIVEIDPHSGRASTIERICLTEEDLNRMMTEASST